MIDVSDANETGEVGNETVIGMVFETPVNEKELLKKDF